MSTLPELMQYSRHQKIRLPFILNETATGFEHLGDPDRRGTRLSIRRDRMRRGSRYNPFMKEFEKNRDLAISHLSQSDAVMAATISRVGPCSLKLRRMRFASLVRAIVGQQISTKAAQSIYERLRRHVAPRGITTSSLSAVSAEDLRELGLSQQKARYVLDLVEKVGDRSVKLDRHRDYDDDAVIHELTQVKGIGRWTAEMYLMFSLGRPDIIPLDDFGIQTAMLRLYRPGADKIDRQTMKEIAEPWRPFRTIACWYCWQSLD